MRGRQVVGYVLGHVPVCPACLAKLGLDKEKIKPVNFTDDFGAEGLECTVCGTAIKPVRDESTK